MPSVLKGYYCQRCDLVEESGSALDGQTCGLCGCNWTQGVRFVKCETEGCTSRAHHHSCNVHIVDASQEKSS